MVYATLLTLCVACGGGALTMLAAPDAHWVQQNAWALRVFTWGFAVFGLGTICSTKWMRTLVGKIVSAEQTQQKTIQQDARDHSPVTAVGSVGNVAQGASVNIGPVSVVGQQFHLTDPILHLEPEGGTVNHAGQRGDFILTLVNTGLEDTERIHVFTTLFLAQKRSGSVLLKHVGPMYTVPNQIIDKLGIQDSVAVNLNFSELLPIIREAGVNGRVPYLFGAKIVVKFRRHADGKDFEIVRGYGMDLYGVILYSPTHTSFGVFDFGELMPYLQSPDHWSSVARILCGNPDGSVSSRYE